jgi:tagatose-1,6-bisphosphate aldolase
VPDNVWFIDGTGAATQIFDCSGLLCGRIIWLHKVHDTAGQRAHDNKNPDPAFLQCRPARPDHSSGATAGGS